MSLSTASTAAPSDLPAPGVGASVWTGRILSGLIVALLLLDAGGKLAEVPEVVAVTQQLGWSAGSVRPVGAVLALCTLLYAVPRTSVLGALLLTAYLGGAVATHARIGSPMLTHTLFGVYLGIVLWLGLWLRDARLRALLPFKR